MAGLSPPPHDSHLPTQAEVDTGSLALLSGSEGTWTECLPRPDVPLSLLHLDGASALVPSL